jgi:hypothetical protein
VLSDGKVWGEFNTYPNSPLFCQMLVFLENTNRKQLDVFNIFMKNNKMKKILMLLLIVPVLGFGQGTKIKDNTISIVVNSVDLTASELHSRLNNAIANIFNSANDVVQLNDVEGKRIVVKGLAKIIVANSTKAMYKKTKAIPETYEYDHDIALNIASKDGRYRLQLTYSDGKIWIPATQYSASRWKDLEYPAKMDYTQEDIDLFIDFWKKDMENSNWALVGKKRKQLFLDFIPKQIKLYETALIEYANNLFAEIIKAVDLGETDDW